METRVLLYAWDHEGLGHVSRILAVIRGMMEMRSTTRCFILAEQESPLLRSAGVPFVCVPALPRAYRGSVASPDDPHVELERELKEAVAAQIVQTVLAHFRPHIIVYDTVLWAPLFGAAAGGLPQLLVVRWRKDMAEYVASLERDFPHVDAVILPHRPAEIEVEVFPPAARAKVHAVGPILRVDRRDLQPDSIRRKYDIRPDRRMVVVTGGAGGYQEHQQFFHLATEAIGRVAAGPVLGIIVSGYFFAGAVTLPSAPGVTWCVVNHEERLLDLMASADLVVTQVGYNTIHELVDLQTPVVLVPGHRPYDDQVQRARQLAASFTCAAVVEEWSLEALEAAVRQVWSCPRSSGGTAVSLPEPVADGRRLCAETIFRIVDR